MASCAAQQPPAAGGPASPPGCRFTVDWMTPHQHLWRQHVTPLLAGRPRVRVLEIGCWEGRSALWLLRHVADHPSSRLVCVDPFERCHAPFLANRLAFEANLRAAGEQHRVHHLHMESHLALPLLIVEALQQAAAPASPPPGSAADVVAPTPAMAPAPAGDAGSAAAAAEVADGGGGPTRTSGGPTAAAGGEGSATAAGGGAARDGPAAGEGAGAGIAGEGGVDASGVLLPLGCLFDLVYVDGSHMRADVLTDAVMAWRLLKVGGVMVFDDYEWDRYRDNLVCHPQQAVDAFLAVFGHQLRVLSRGYQVMVQRTG